MFNSRAEAGSAWRAVKASAAEGAGQTAGTLQGTEVVQRAMSLAELQATKTTGLLRGGRTGTHYVSDSVNSNALRARQRLALGQTPEVRAILEVGKGAFSPPSKVQPLNGMLGGGSERTATGQIPVKVIGEELY
jgi:hypothetical protein